MEEVEKVQKALAELEARLGALMPAGEPRAIALEAPREADWLDQLDHELAERLAGATGGQTTPSSVTDLSIALLETLELARQIVADIRRAQGSQQDQRRHELEAELRQLEEQAASLRDELDRVAQRLQAVQRELATMQQTSVGRT